MNCHQITIINETPLHEHEVELLSAHAFGPGRFARTAFRLREGNVANYQLSFVAMDQTMDGPKIIGSVRVTGITIGENHALLLGPLVVSAEFKCRGVGGELMRKAVSAAKLHSHRLMILVGDEPFYAPFGFKRVPQTHGKLQFELPGPVDPARFLYCDFDGDAVGGYSGVAR